MAQNDELLNLARSVSQDLAETLSPAAAKLYSHYTRLGAGQPGLTNWHSAEAANRLDDAVRLVDAALFERDAGYARWTESMLRAAELLEWLSHPALNPDDLPVRLLAAAAYQLAGYPARASGLLGVDSESLRQTDPLWLLLRGDFPGLLRALMRHWSSKPRRPGDSTDVIWSGEAPSTVQLRRYIEDETASALGVLCAEMRWGSIDRIDAALDKLAAVAKFMLNGRDRYSWLLAKLVAETARTVVNTSIRRRLQWLPSQLDESGKIAGERYLRQAYSACRTQVWPSQQRGIERLEDGQSFALCTPTGSGKTTVAEIAILQSLFAPFERSENGGSPLIMYLVPKRALAAEIEAKFLRTIAPLTDVRVVITGLYGGIDWGPTDIWLTTDDRTVLICTYEKAEALIRFLGPLFLARLSLVILDEAHMVQFDGRINELRTAESRPLRLESLIARLFVHIPAHQSRVIALSAVAAGIESPLAKWITGNESGIPARTDYRSTRQLIGRLRCNTGRAFDIRYDLLDRASLRFDGSGDADTLFIPRPFPPYPAAATFESKAKGPEQVLRPYLFWAAMNFVAPVRGGPLHTVLVSIPQQIGGYAQAFLDLLDSDWSNAEVPLVFQPPTDPVKQDMWRTCLLACGDYFGSQSREYQLLQRGIVVHHGKMPGLMGRLLIRLVDEGVVHLILATSTLSEGVNLPFEVILLPTLRRNNETIPASEFANLAGRAGRPGFGTEGRCLVLLPGNPRNWSEQHAVGNYERLIQQLVINPQTAESSTGAQSALAMLLIHIRLEWQKAFKLKSETEFLNWLEETATLTSDPNDKALDVLTETLDSLDSLLLAGIVEIESLRASPLTPTELEGKLAEIWQRCYAHYSLAEEATLGGWFVSRGRALTTRIYPDPSQRRRLYQSGLPPRLGDRLLRLYPDVKQYLITGANYAVRNTDERFEFIETVVSLLGTHPKFALASKTPNKTRWQDILRWWLDPQGPVKFPNAAQVSAWYDYVATNFNYRFAWGIGCIIALATNEAHGDTLRPTTLEEWDLTTLPWIALWLKELMVWGTLDPVAAYLLGRSRASTRSEAGEVAREYFRSHEGFAPNELLDPTRIRRWADTLPKDPPRESTRQAPKSPLSVKLERIFPKTAARRWRVLPAEFDGRLGWVDPAGFLLAVGERPSTWLPSFLDDGDFFLDVESQTVSHEPYL
jgi:hypothetical protein